MVGADIDDQVDFVAPQQRLQVIGADRVIQGRGNARRLGDFAAQ
jgi:hypothetical protein